MTENLNQSSLEGKLIEQYREISQQSLSMYEKAIKVFPSGVTRRTVFFPPYPNYIVRGEGCRIYDLDGREYIDYANNYGPLILGHCPPGVTKAIGDQLQHGTVLGGPTELEIDLAEKILEAIPSGEQVLFCASGSEAGMISLRALRAYTGKEKILRCAGSYHGSSDFFVHGTGVSKDISAKTVSVPFNDIEEFEKAVKKHKHELAAVYMEPIMRGIPPEPSYLRQVRRITENHGIMLVFDEVVTGFRLSRGGAQQRWNITPDVTMLGKLIGGGLPIGAVVASKKILAAYASSATSGLKFDAPAIIHGGTYNAHPLAMAGGLATLEELTPSVYAHLDSMGELIRSGMKDTLGRAGVKAQIVGISSVFHIHFTDQNVIDSQSASSADPYLQRYFDLSMLVRGIFTAKAHCSFISSPVTKEEVSQTLGAFEQTIDSMKPLIAKVAPRLL
jgi:glutamate-1-semialdehyde 2,1-aminomutase